MPPPTSRYLKFGMIDSLACCRDYCVSTGGNTGGRFTWKLEQSSDCPGMRLLANQKVRECLGPDGTAREKGEGPLQTSALPLGYGAGGRLRSRTRCTFSTPRCGLNPSLRLVKRQNSFAGMCRLRDSRFVAWGLAVLIGTAGPAAALAHAEAHHHEAETAQHHLTSLDVHDGRTELATPDHADTHQHTSLDRATRSASSHLVFAALVPASAADLAFAVNERTVCLSFSLTARSDPPNDDPPRPRSPPLH